MSNHYHLLVETPRGNLHRFQQYVNSSYSQQYNRRHGRSGHLLGGRYKARLVEGDRYLLALTRYVHLNPLRVRDQQKRTLREQITLLRVYPWSSYPGYAGLKEREVFVDYGPLEGIICQGKRDKAKTYREFVETGLAGNDRELEEAMAQSQRAIGERSYCRKVEEQFQQELDKQKIPEQVALRRMKAGRSPQEILRAVARALNLEGPKWMQRRGRMPERLVAMHLLQEEGGLSQHEVAAQVGLRDGSAVSHAMREFRERLLTDSDARRALERARIELESMNS
jgi:hypothetical protein